MILCGLVTTLKNQLFDAEFLYFYTEKMQKLRKTTMDELSTLQNYLHDRQCRPEDALIKIRELVEECWIRNEYEELRENYKTSDELVELLKEAIDCWPDRLYYFMNWIELRNIACVYIDNYWNCDSRVSYTELMDLIDWIIDYLIKNWEEENEENKEKTITYKEFGNRLSDKLNELAKKDWFFD